MAGTAFDGLVWLVVCLVVFILVKRALDFEIQAIFLLIFRKPNFAIGLYSILFLPGVLLHELSHYLTARLLGVKTGRFSIQPQVLANGRLRLGYVTTAQTDVIRDTMIGVAPLLLGGILTTWISLDRLGLSPLADALFHARWDGVGLAFDGLTSRPDFWVWFYLAFAISRTMLPSASDRRSWLPVGIGILVLLGLVLLAGAGPWMLANLAPTINRGFRGLGLIFGFSAGVHLILFFPAWILRLFLGRITGLQVNRA